MLISVVMSVYNSVKYLREAIESVLCQTYADFEFVIIDDGSTDGSLIVLKDYAMKDSRIKLIVNDSNLGLAESLNKGIRYASGEFIARQDADDLSSVDRLEKQLAYAINHPEVDVIGSNCYIIDINGGIVYENKLYSQRTDIERNLLSSKAIFPHGSAFFRKSTAIRVGLYDTRFYYSQDGEFWLRLHHNGAIIRTMDEALYLYRSAPKASHRKQMAQRMYNRVKNMIYAEKCQEVEIDRELLKIRKHLDGPKDFPAANQMAYYWKSLANGAYFNGGKKSISYRYIFKAMREENSITNLINYTLMCLLYLFPSNIIKQLFKIDQGINSIGL